MTSIPGGGARPRSGLRSVRVVAALAAAAVLTAACSSTNPRASGGVVPDASRLPHTTIGALLFSPPRDAVEVDPGAAVVVQSRYSDAHLTRVDLTRDGGEAIAGTLTGDGFVATHSLVPDARYTVTATVSLPPDSTSGSPSGSPSDSPSDSPSGSPSSSGSGSGSEQTETVSFSTATTPKVVSVSPTVVGPGEAAVVTLDHAAKDVKVDGPANAQLGPDGTTISLYPQDYRPGAIFSVSLTAISMAGVSGGPQPANFVATGGATFTTSFNNGDGNLGVASPLIVGVSQAPSDPAAFAAHFTVTADVTATVAAAVPTGTFVAPTGQADPCFEYPPNTATTFGVTATWLSPTRLQFKPKTPDGYWPPDATINVTGSLDGLTALDGAAFPPTFHRAFATGDKRVIDVDLSSQTLTACRNGSLANQFPVSTGVPGKETHTGTYAIYERHVDAEMKSADNAFAADSYDVKHVPWTQYFHNGEALHGAWWHNNFGHPMSHGCVNVSTQTRNVSWPNAAPNAEWLWNFDNLGDPVVVHGTTP